MQHFCFELPFTAIPTLSKKKEPSNGFSQAFVFSANSTIASSRETERVLHVEQPDCH